MTTPLADYLSALEMRDAREKAHERYINAFTKLADKTAAQTRKKDVTPQGPITTDPVSSTSTKSSPNDDTAKIRAELASTQKTRTMLETQLAATAAELTAYKQTSAEQKKRITFLETSKAQLERRMKDRQDELKGKGRFVENVQDEMVALTLQLNMAEKETERLRKENKELTERWIRRMEEEAERMNDEMGWEDARSKVKGKGK